MLKKQQKELKRKQKRKETKKQKEAKKAYMKDLIDDIYDKRTAAILNFIVDQGYKHHENNIFKQGNRVFTLKRLRTNAMMMEALGEDAKKMNGIYGLEPKSGEGGLVIQVMLKEEEKLIEFDCSILDVEALQKKLKESMEKKNNTNKEKDGKV